MKRKKIKDWIWFIGFMMLLTTIVALWFMNEIKWGFFLT